MRSKGGVSPARLLQLFVNLHLPSPQPHPMSRRIKPPEDIPGWIWDLKIVFKGVVTLN